MKRVVVCGGAGFIGSHLADRLKKKYDVVVWDRKLPYSPDLSNYDMCLKYIKKVEPTIIFDLATLPLSMSLDTPYYLTYKLFCIANNLCELLRDGYYKTLIHTSSSEVYGELDYISHSSMSEDHILDPHTPYAGAKIAQDMIMLSYQKCFNLDIRIARPFNTYGPRQDLGAIIPSTIKHILKGEEPVLTGDGYQTKDFIYVDDTVEGIIKIWENKGSIGRVINIAREEPISMQGLVNTVSDIMGYKGEIRYVPQRRADICYQRANPMEAKVLLGFEAKTCLNEGLKKTIKWWKKELST